MNGSDPVNAAGAGRWGDMCEGTSRTARRPNAPNAPNARLTGMSKQLCGVLAVMGAALLCLCACAAPGGESFAASSGVQSSSAPAQSASSASSSSSSEAGSEALPVSAQTILPPDVVTDPSANPLTGLARPEDAPGDTRPLAVMVDDLQTALPQRGLQSADLIYEAVTEGGVTRLMAVFSDYTAMPQTGPVCFARGEHVRLLLGLDALYLYAGASPDAAALMEQYLPDARALDGQDRAGALSLDTQRGQNTDSEHCWFTDGALFDAAAQRYALDTAPAHDPRAVFQFVPYEEDKRLLADGGAGEVYLRFSSYANSTFSYDEETGQYVKSQFGAPHLDENTGEAVTFDNLLVLFASDGGQAGVSGAWSGAGCYLCGGRYELIRWMQPAPDAPLSILTNDETLTLAQINPGRSYVAVVERAMRPYFRIDGKAVLSAAG